MEKIRLEIIGLSYSQTQSGAYALVLGEVDGKKRLPIVIGGFEAQAIAIELEKMKPSRPLTYDLFKSFSDSFDIKITEVIIYNLTEGVFYAKLICNQDGKVVELDSRTSDAIALALRFNCPVFTYQFILEDAGIILEEGEEDDFSDDEDDEDELLESEINIDELNISEDSFTKYSKEDLNQALEKAIDEEDYEKASKIRDELNKRD